MTETKLPAGASDDGGRKLKFLFLSLSLDNMSNIERRMNNMLRNWGFGPEWGLAPTELPTLDWDLAEPLPARDAGTRPLMPSLDVLDNDRELCVFTELPGLKKDQINLEVQGNQLVINGRTDEQQTAEGARWRLRERSFGRFERRVALPASCDPEKIHAKFEDGLLKVHIAKHAQQQQKAVSIDWWLWYLDLFYDYHHGIL